MIEQDYTEFAVFQDYIFKYLQKTGFYLKGIGLNELRQKERQRFLACSLQMWKELGGFRSDK